MIFRLSIILVVFSGCRAENVTTTPEEVVLNLNNKTWKEMLRDKITPFNFRNPVLPPINGVNVDLELTLGSFSLQWSDDRLSWLPEDYGGLEFIDAGYSWRPIWLPEIVVSGRPGDNGVKMAGQCRIQYTGQVKCFPDGFYGYTDSGCVLDMTEYPYDIQKCTVMYASWSTTNNQMNVTVKPFVRLGKWKYSSEYSITSNSTTVTDYEEHFVRMPFVSVLLLIGLSLWLNPIRLSLRLRLMLICVVMLFFQLMYIALKLVYQSSGVPYAVTTISRTLILSTILVIWYTMAHRMVYNQQMSHKFVQMLSRVKLGALGASVPKRKGKTMAESEEDGRNEELDESFPDEHWFTLVVLVDRVFFIVFIQFVLFSRY